MSRFQTVLILAARKKAQAAAERAEAHALKCSACRAGKPCTKDSAGELERAMQENKPVAQ